MANNCLYEDYKINKVFLYPNNELNDIELNILRLHINKMFLKIFYIWKCDYINHYISRYEELTLDDLSSCYLEFMLQRFYKPNFIKIYLWINFYKNIFVDQIL